MEACTGVAATQPRVLRSALRAGLGAIAFDTLKPVTAALIAVCCVVVAVDVTIRDPATAMRLSVGTGLFAAISLAVHIVLRRRLVNEGAAHAMTTLCSLAVILLVLFRAYMIPNPLQLSALTLTIITSGLFILAAGWLGLNLVTALIGWGVVAWIVPFHALDAMTVLLLLGGAIVAVVAHVLRVHTFDRQEALRLRAERARVEAERAMSALRESEAQTRAIVDTALDGVIGLDNKGVITRWNAQAEEIFGWSADEAIGRSLATLVLPPRHREGHEARLAAYNRGGPESTLSQRIEIEVLHRDGHVFPAEVAITPLGSGAGLRFNGFVRDVTLRRKVETAMREEAYISGAMARVGYELIEAMNTSDLLARLCRLTAEVLECDFSHTILLQPKSEEYVPVCGYGDPAEHWDSLRLLHVSASSLVSALEQLKRETVVRVDVDTPAQSDVLGRLLLHYEVTAIVFVALRHGDDVIGVQTAGYRGRHEPFSGSRLNLARELAQIASLALQNVRLVEELQQANRLKSEFVATMSHELRTPLNVVLGYNELLLDGAVGPLSAQQTDVLERSNRSAQQLLELITATLDLSRLETGRVEIDLRRVQLADLAADVDTEVQFMRGDKPSLDVHWNVPRSLPVLFTDRAKLKLVIKNLVGNALKFTDSGRITVTGQAIKGGVEITVVDTGIGIPDEALSTIFDPFRQVDGSSTRRYGGVGLGLYIVRRLVEMLGGEVSVESQVGNGSRFRVWIPRTIAPAAVETGDEVEFAEAPISAEMHRGA